MQYDASSHSDSLIAEDTLPTLVPEDVHTKEFYIKLTDDQVREFQKWFDVLRPPYIEGFIEPSAIFRDFDETVDNLPALPILFTTALYPNPPLPEQWSVLSPLPEEDQALPPTRHSLLQTFIESGPPPVASLSMRPKPSSLSPPRSPLRFTETEILDEAALPSPVPSLPELPRKRKADEPLVEPSTRSVHRKLEEESDVGEDFLDSSSDYEESDSERAHRTRTRANRVPKTKKKAPTTTKTKAPKPVERKTEIAVQLYEARELYPWFKETFTKGATMAHSFCLLCILEDAANPQSTMDRHVTSRHRLPISRAFTSGASLSEREKQLMLFFVAFELTSPSAEEQAEIGKLKSCGAILPHNDDPITGLNSDDFPALWAQVQTYAHFWDIEFNCTCGGGPKKKGHQQTRQDALNRHIERQTHVDNQKSSGATKIAHRSKVASLGGKEAILHQIREARRTGKGEVHL